jgi:hypothetical protein
MSSAGRAWADSTPAGSAPPKGPQPPIQQGTQPGAGEQGEDPVTANLRAAFQAAEITADSLEILTLGSHWSCNYHAANPFVLFNGARDVVYDATFVRRSFLMMETVTGVQAGPVSFPGWTHWLGLSSAGLQFNANGEEDISEVIRLEPDGPAIVEFLFQPLGFFDPSDVAVADPSRNTAGFALCTPDEGPQPYPPRST